MPKRAGGGSSRPPENGFQVKICVSYPNRELKFSVLVGVSVVLLLIRMLFCFSASPSLLLICSRCLCSAALLCCSWSSTVALLLFCFWLLCSCCFCSFAPLVLCLLLVLLRSKCLAPAPMRVLCCFCSFVPCPLILLCSDFSAFALLLLRLCFCLVLLVFCSWSFSLALLLLFLLSNSSAPLHVFLLFLQHVLSCSPGLASLLLLVFAFGFLVFMKPELELWQIWFLFPRGGFMFDAERFTVY